MISKICILIISLFFLIYASCIQGLEILYENETIEIKGDFAELEKSIKKINGNNFLKIDIEGYGKIMELGLPELPVFTRLIGLPPSGNFVLESISYKYNETILKNSIQPAASEDKFKMDNKFYNKDVWFPEQLVKISDPVIMRGYRFCQISIIPVQYNPYLNKLREIEDISIKLEIDPTIEKNNLKKDHSVLSSSFYQIAKNNIMGIDKPKCEFASNYLFIIPDSVCLPTLEPLLRWKEKLGYKTRVVTLAETGSSNNEIKDYLQYAYDNWDDPPENVVLVGDVNGNFVVPAFYVEGYLTNWDVSDHNYSTLEGDDYFPDIFIGRFSIQTLPELMSIVSKIINYESDPYLGGDWFKKSLMICFINDLLEQYSHYITKVNIAEKLIDFGYDQVDGFIYPFNTGQQNLANMINNGYSLINFRGCGSFQYWVSYSGYIFFYTEDIENLLNNGFMLPMITSMTCGGGDFAAEQASTCFGERWLNAGTTANPKGAIGFIGPSEWDTKTAWNNANDMGIYQGITQEGLYRCGQMLLRGKMELYINYPHNHEWGGAEDSDQFYFYVYNLLGDPGLSVWTDTPQEINFFFNEQVVCGTNFVEVIVDSKDDDLSDFTVSITNDDSLIAKAKTCVNGKADLICDLPIGNYFITVSKQNYQPKTETFSVVESDIIKIVDYAFNKNLLPGDTVNVDISIQNTSDITALSIKSNLSSPTDYIDLLIDSVYIDSLGADEVAICEFLFVLGNKWENGREINLELEVDSNINNDKFLIPLNISSPELVLSDFIVNNPDSCLVQNQTEEIFIQLTNCGGQNSDNIDAVLNSMNDKVEVIDSTSTYNGISINDSIINNDAFKVVVKEVITGESAQFNLKLMKDDSLLQTIDLSYPIGVIGTNSPTFGPYGYYAIENTDYGFFTPPVYDWIELDPQYGGNGIELNSDFATSDGYIKIIDLPFSFCYFGQFYDTLTVCSNGWLAMGIQLVYHRNKTIPSGSGPPAMIAPFWDNLANGKMFIFYDEDDHYFVIEWSRWENVYDPNCLETFEVVLYDPEYYPTKFGNGEILFQYKEIYNVDQEDNYATVGIENHAQNMGLLLNYSNILSPTAHELQNESAILFTSKDNPAIPILSVQPEELNQSLPADTSIIKTITIHNEGEIGTQMEYNITLSHFRKNSGKGSFRKSKDISDDFIIAATSSYIPVMPRDITFYLYHASPDNEPIYGAKMDFPRGVYVNDAYDIESLHYNGEVGYDVEATWGFGNGAPLTNSGPNGFIVNVTIDDTMYNPINIDWYLCGDGSGSPPHSVSGTITIPPTSNSYLWISYPNGGETLVYGLEDSVVWQKYGSLEFVKIQLSRDNGITWELLDENLPNSGCYNYTVTGPLADACKFKVSSMDGIIYDNSDASFQITAIDVIYPEAGDQLVYNTVDTIRWINSGSIENVNIDLTLDNGVTWLEIAQNTESDSMFAFTVPGPPSNRCVMRISDAEGDITNYSKGLFSIVDSPIDWIIADTTFGIIAGGQSIDLQINLNTENLPQGIYEAYIKITSEIGQEINIPVQLEVVQSNDDQPEIEMIQLCQNQPNPFCKETSFKYSLPKESFIELNVYNIKGQIVRTILSEKIKKGEHIYTFNGKNNKGEDLPSGVYFYQLKVNSQNGIINKMILIR